MDKSEFLKLLKELDISIRNNSISKKDIIAKIVPNFRGLDKIDSVSEIKNTMIEIKENMETSFSQLRQIQMGLQDKNNLLSNMFSKLASKLFDIQNEMDLVQKNKFFK